MDWADILLPDGSGLERVPWLTIMERRVLRPAFIAYTVVDGDPGTQSSA
jgi:hypothetical protein